jgi:hypothetical protein
LEIDWNNSIEYVECTDAYNLPDGDKVAPFLTRLLKPYKYILAVGISGTGKSSTLSHYEGQINRPLTRWNRSTIWEMIDIHGGRDDALWGDIDNFERAIFPKIFEKVDTQIIVENWGRTPQGRKKYLNLMPKGLGNTLCLVFDGPIDLIVKRTIEAGNHTKFGKSEEDIDLYLRQLYDGFKWPSFMEGWTSIIYLNTFGEEGEKYLARKVGGSSG